MAKYKKVILAVVITILLIFVLLIVLNKDSDNKILGNLFKTNIAKALTNNTELNYIIYDNQDVTNVKSLFTIANDNGIDYIIKPDGTKINANGKKKIVTDITSVLDEEINLKIKSINSEEEQEKITITQDKIDDQFKLEDITQDSEHIGINVEPNLNNNFDDKFNIFYKTDNNSQNWFRYRTKEQLKRFYLEKPDEIETEQKNLFFKMQDMAGNAVYTTKTVYENPALIPSRLTLNKSAITLKKEQREQLIATVTPASIDSKSIQWTSSDPSVATVSDTGLVTTLRKKGTTVITASVEGLSATCTVGVQNTVVNYSTCYSQNINLPDGWTVYVSASTDSHNSGSIVGYKGYNCTGENIWLWSKGGGNPKDGYPRYSGNTTFAIDPSEGIHSLKLHGRRFRLVCILYN